MRTYDASIFNEIANHHEVVRSLSWNPDDGLLLFDNLALEPEYFALLHNPKKTLGMIFEWSAPGVWQLHTMSLPGSRGAEMFEDARTLVHEMFVEHGADMLWGQTPIGNRAARMFNRKIGAKSVGFGQHVKCGEVERFRNYRAEWLLDYWR